MSRYSVFACFLVVVGFVMLTPANATSDFEKDSAPALDSLEKGDLALSPVTMQEPAENACVENQAASGLHVVNQLDDILNVEQPSNIERASPEASGPLAPAVGPGGSQPCTGFGVSCTNHSYCAAKCQFAGCDYQYSVCWNNRCVCDGT